MSTGTSGQSRPTLALPGAAEAYNHTGGTMGTLYIIEQGAVISRTGERPRDPQRPDRAARAASGAGGPDRHFRNAS